MVALRLRKRRFTLGDIPLVAIGGIKFEQSAEIFAAGADSIAASATSRRTSTDARVRQWLAEPRHDPPSQDHGMIL
jgi:thiamine monophosphate synthase